MLIIAHAHAFSCCSVKKWGVTVRIWVQLAQVKWLVLGNKVIFHMLVIGGESVDHLSDSRRAVLFAVRCLPRSYKQSVRTVKVSPAQ
jgi:hypothetical protein